ncbi:hypothetical protein [Segatella baroniae]|uniref:Uncharacterized protein n=1 Tax=Segatella baroniae F0067 TaxID=1115809 RepID=U2P8E4_9BACT|nr:hypothetical protein [Segatella baroniae]ERK39954.1 hypothetical protein HMPREF9135_0001 [Segatella baroniae F0067]
MKLQQLLLAYEFDEIMPAINQMFPGTSKYREPLQKAYDILTNMTPVASGKTIRYKIMDVPGGKGEQYMGANDADFRGSWEVSLGKEVSRERGVDLSDVEVLANCLVNLCFLGDYPREFETAHKALLKR